MVAPGWYTHPLHEGDFGDDVRAVQLLLRCNPTGFYDNETRAKVRGYQTIRSLGQSGRVDEATATSLGELK